MKNKEEKCSDFLKTKLSAFDGVGPKRTKLLSLMGLETAKDILNFFPRRYEDRRNVSKISSLVAGRPSVIFAKVTEIERRKLSKPGLELVSALIEDGTAAARASWFNRKGLEYILKEGTTAAFFGTPRLSSSVFEFMNPEFEVFKDTNLIDSFTGIIPIYPSTAGLPQRWFSHFARDIVTESLPFVKETLPDFIMEKRALLPLCDALRTMHMPPSPEEWKEARRRIAYEELLLVQSAMALRRIAFKAQKSPSAIKPGAIYREFIHSLPFDMTESQKKILEEIFADTGSQIPMSRLLQGDVGSGKTIIALGLAAAAADSGVQCSLMAPTEILADQLFSQAEKYLAPRGAMCVLVKGGQKNAQRIFALEAVKSGDASVVVGTQALLESGVEFKNLGAVIIDEQHRFGVAQRGALTKKGSVPHTLLMSATPIPRTLTMCAFGDLDISFLREKPKGRTRVETRVVGMEKMKVLLKFIYDEIKTGGRVYWVCPRVDDEESSVINRNAFLRKYFGGLGVAMVHGRMASDEKSRAIADFHSGKCRILAGTTVIEVGIDVPEASLIVIESAEMFGLSQLHQLRGRVGRGAKRGVCILLVSDEKTENGRLAVMAETDDGFEIAEADLRTRGYGEVSGSMQHGSAEFKTADLAKDAKLLMQAAEDAKEWVSKKEYEEAILKFTENFSEIKSPWLGVG